MLIVLGVIAAALIGWLCSHMWGARNREFWESNANPSAMARVVEISGRKLRREGKGACFQMTVRFSDGYIYMTQATNNRETVDDAFKRKITARASAAHRNAVRKKRRMK